MELTLYLHDISDEYPNPNAWPSTGGPQWPYVCNSLPEPQKKAVSNLKIRDEEFGAFILHTSSRSILKADREAVSFIRALETDSKSLQEIIKELTLEPKAVEDALNLLEELQISKN